MPSKSPTLKLDRNGTDPLYDQAKQAIQEYIVAHQLAPNSLLPSEREFSELFSVSRLTLRKAIDELVEEGRVFRRPGKGTFVSLPKFEQRLFVLTSFTEAVKQEGHTPGTQVLEVKVETASHSVCEALKIAVGLPVLKVQRLRSVDNIPFSIATSYLPHDLTANLQPADFQTHSLYALLENKCGISLAKSQVSLEATVAKRNEATLLKVKANAPLFLMRGTVAEKAGRVIEYFKVVYRGDRLRFVAESN